MGRTFLQILSRALAVVARELGEDVQRVVGDLGRTNALLRDEEMSLEGHADMFSNVQSIWDRLARTEFNRQPFETDDMIVPPRPKAKLIAAINSRLPKLPRAAAWALNSKLRLLRGRLTWARLFENMCVLLSYLHGQTRAALVRAQAAESRRDELCLQRDQLRTDVYTVSIAGRAADLQHQKAQGRLELLPGGALLAVRLPAPPLTASLPAAGRPAGAEAGRSCPPSNRRRRGAPGGPTGPANMNPVALGDLRRAAVRAVRELGMAEVELEIELNQAEADRMGAHLRFVAHSDLYGDLLIHFNGFADDDSQLGEPAPAGVREGLATAIRRNQPALIRNGGCFRHDNVSLRVQALSVPIIWGELKPRVRSWLINLNREMGDDLCIRGQAKIRRDALQLRLAQARSDSCAARLAVLALDVLSRRKPGELLPAVPWPAGRLPAPLPAHLPPAEAPTIESSPARPSFGRPGSSRPSSWPPASLS